MITVAHAASSGYLAVIDSAIELSETHTVSTC